MWVADMDFATPNMVFDAIQARCQADQILGYIEPSLAPAEAVCAWQKARHQWQVDTDAVVWMSGVVSGIYLAIQTLTQPEDSIMVLTPIYPPFMRSVQHLGRKLVMQPLQLDAHFRYQLDWQGIEDQIRQHRVKLLLLSNPHNPSGRVWTEAELRQLADLCMRHQVAVVSDEVWSDLLLDQTAKHLPFASLSPEIAERTITLNAPSKTFNLAALHTAFALITNSELKQRFVQQQQQTRAGEASLFGLVAVQAVYSEAGRAWLAELLDYLRGNLVLLNTALLAQTSVRIETMPPQASYLLWTRFGDVKDQQAIMRHCTEVWGVGLSSGLGFGEQGRGFMRWNFALPRSRLIEVLAVLTTKPVAIHV